MCIDRWVDKQNVVHPHTGILFSPKKDILTQATAGGNLEGIMPRDLDQTQETNGVRFRSWDT